MLPIFVFLFAIPLIANDYVVVNKEGNVYDMANAKYATENQNGEAVVIIPGMVFSTSEHTPGWYKVEYSPGLNAFMPEAVVAESFVAPKAGSFQVANQPGNNVIIESSGNSWTLTSNGNQYSGEEIGNIVIFTDNNNIVFTEVDLGQGPIVINYDNAVTKFF